MLRLHVLDLGRMKMDANLVAQKTSIATLDNPKRPNYMAEFPVPAFLIETDRGYMMFDTGCHPVAMLPDGRWPEEFQKQCPWDGDETKTPMHILKQMGIKPSDIKTIIISHMHNDHAGCIEFFPKAHYIVAKEE
jgi:N-acyl homoserine lactone hydrolase